ncbi:hypothetical protein TI39_contig368g00002 [Zymoseptoria brevis]|uniref:Ams2/SPT21 N-terminal domain-containing protein n=1 Tax=Zymoseptoria brevis TaxID=1047168 RepID=A0A0F4GPR8_9PEZI|nr:hypothetical protein TI39_contig368g00002 [Zymoseptoria brevis]
MDSSDGDGSDLGDIPTRPMRIKVIYTFDAENKITCLARFNGIHNIPAVAIDEQMQVGVIELQQCLETITSASPEILSQLESGDFTVYSTDYSEQDALLVGQGRLSLLLAASSGMGTPSTQNKTMITGRVLKNSALFSNGVKETLEVRFKLTPLSRPAIHDSAKHTDAIRSNSPTASAGFDPNAWNSSMAQNQLPPDYFNFGGMLGQGGDNGDGMLEDMFGMCTGVGGSESGVQQMGGAGVGETPTDSAFAYNPAFQTHSHSAPGSRAGSPMVHSNSSLRNEQLRHMSFSGNATNMAELSRPDSRGSVRSEYTPSYPQQTYPNQQQNQAQDQQQVQYRQQQSDAYNEDGQARKRAKVVQADWRGRSSFGSKSGDLRVTAATASSMHMHRPIAKRPTAPGSNLDPPPRVPTPVPQRTLLPHQRSRQAHGPRSMLRQSSIADSDFMSDADVLSDAVTSPEGSSPGNSIEGTPMDIPSSPPLVPGFNQQQPSSPGLPTLAHSKMPDSGYMSGSFNSGTVMESLEDDENRSPDGEDMDAAARYRSRRSQQPFVKIEGAEIDTAPMSDIRTESTGPNTLQAPRRVATSTTSPTFEQPHDTGSRRESLALPPKPVARASSQSGNAAPKQKRKPLQRSRTTYNESEAGSPAPSDTEGRPRGQARSGSAAPRRKIIEQRLQASIANGEMPQFCTHCGAIETPTWRKIYVNKGEGKPSPLDYVEGEGETIGVEITETDEVTNAPLKYVIRKCMKKTKLFSPGQGFEETIVCNPCGLWFTKTRKMRPADKWHRKSNSRKSRKAKGDESLLTDGVEPQSDAFFTDQITLEDDAEDGEAVEEATADSSEPPADQPARRNRPRAISMQSQVRRASGADGGNGRIRRDAAMMRATQSSPVRLRGSQASPIELEETPVKPTRRLLFPSPRRDGEEKSLDDGKSAARKSNLSSPPLPSEKTVKAAAKSVTIAEQTDINVFEVFTNDQENLPPPLDNDENYDDLFDGSPGTIFKSPFLRRTPSKRTPTSQKVKHFDDLLKTPKQSTRKRKALTENPNCANNPDLDAILISPSASRYFLRSTPSRVERTPGGRSVSGGSQRAPVEMSPFSRHLSQMLGDATGTSEPAFTSPSQQQFDFSDLPTFDHVDLDMDWKGMSEILSSEFVTYEGASNAAGGA